MKLQLKLLLAFNAAMFGIAGLLEWRYYTAHDSDPHKAVDVHGSLNAAAERRPALNLEELHKSFQNKLQNFTTDTASNGLVALPHAQQAAEPPIPGDGSGHELPNAAIVLICYNRYTIAANAEHPVLSTSLTAWFSFTFNAVRNSSWYHPATPQAALHIE